MRFRTTVADGLLLLQHKSADVQGDYLAIIVSSGYVEVSFNLGKEPVDRLYFLRSDERVNDGQWHTLEFVRLVGVFGFWKNRRSLCEGGGAKEK